MHEHREVRFGRKELVCDGARVVENAGDQRTELVTLAVEFRSGRDPHRIDEDGVTSKNALLTLRNTGPRTISLGAQAVREQQLNDDRSCDPDGSSVSSHEFLL